MDILLLDNINSITINDVRNVKRFLSLSAIASKIKAVVLNADLLTIQAQQALLKTVEEPPPHSLLILTTTNSETLLPTLISRSQMHNLEPDQTSKDTKQEKNNVESYWRKLLNISPASRMLGEYDFLRDRESFQKWLIIQIRLIRNVLISSYSFVNPQLDFSSKICWHIIKQLILAYNLSSQNISSRLIHDQLMLNLPQI